MLNLTRSVILYCIFDIQYTTHKCIIEYTYVQWIFSCSPLQYIHFLFKL